MSEGIQRTASYRARRRSITRQSAAPRVELVGYHVDAHPDADFDAFVEQNSAFLDKRLLMRFYSPTTLASPHEGGRVEPDLAPFPGQRLRRRRSRSRCRERVPS